MAAEQKNAHADQEDGGGEIDSGLWNDGGVNFRGTERRGVERVVEGACASAGVEGNEIEAAGDVGGVEEVDVIRAWRVVPDFKSAGIVEHAGERGEGDPGIACGVHIQRGIGGEGECADDFSDPAAEGECAAGEVDRG